MRAIELFVILLYHKCLGQITLPKGPITDDFMNWLTSHGFEEVGLGFGEGLGRF